MINCPRCNMPVDVAKENVDEVLGKLDGKLIAWTIPNLKDFNLGVGSNLKVVLKVEITSIQEGKRTKLKVIDSSITTP